MNWWDILEIDYDSDLKTIKRAYAKLLKINNPEDNPEGYQKLRQAYDIAIKYEKSRRENPNKTENNEFIYREEKIEQPNNLYTLINEFLERLSEIYNDKNLRVDINNWLELMNLEVVWNVESSSIIEDELFNFIRKNKFLLTEVWELLETNYHWSSNELELYKRYDKNRVDEIINLIKCPYKLNIRTIENIDKQYLDEYLSIKVEAYSTAEKREYNESVELINKAKKIYSKDPDLIELYGRIMLYNRVYLVALSYYKEALKLDNTKIECRIYIGILLVVFKKYEDAIPYLERYLNEGDVNKDNNLELVTSNLGLAYYYTNNYKMAKYYFEEYLKVFGGNKRANKYLTNIESKLQGKKVRQIKPIKYRMRKAFKPKEKRKKDTISIINIMKYIICFFLFVMLWGIVYEYTQNDYTKNENNNKMQKSVVNKPDNQKNNESNEEKAKRYIDKVKSIGTIDDFVVDSPNINYSFYLTNITPINLFAIYNKHGFIEICNETYLKENNLLDQIYCNVFIGSISDKNILFVDKNFTMELVDKNGGYTVSGHKKYLGIQELVNFHFFNEDSITIYNYFIDKSE